MTNSTPDETDPEWIEWFSKKMDEASPEEEAFWKRRQRLGLGVGLDEDGSLVYAKDLPEAKKTSKPRAVNRGV
ncbi:hypothetical protein [Sulfitobacter sp. 1A12779]|uniref:hypothetical protein n=1 Tax=Sulfitobacter sp. 1A12779 TaxID=3368599 RepID=UPI0037456051